MNKIIIFSLIFLGFIAPECKSQIYEPKTLEKQSNEPHEIDGIDNLEGTKIKQPKTVHDNVKIIKEPLDEVYYQELWEAVKRHDLKKIMALKMQGVDLNKPAFSRYPAIFALFDKESEKYKSGYILKLYELGFDIDSLVKKERYPRYSTPLFEAIRKCDNKNYQTMLQVKDLITAGANIYLRYDKSRSDYLDESIIRGCVDIVEYLLENNVHYTEGMPDKAIINNALMTINLSTFKDFKIRKKGILSNIERRKILDFIFSDPNITYSDSIMETLFYNLMSNKMFQTLRVMAKNNAWANVCDIKNKLFDNHQLKWVEENFANILELSGDINRKDKYGRTALYCAAKENMVLLVKNLLRKGADKDIKFNEKTPLDIAAEMGNNEIYEMLR